MAYFKVGNDDEYEEATPFNLNLLNVRHLLNLKVGKNDLEKDPHPTT